MRKGKGKVSIKEIGDVSRGKKENSERTMLWKQRKRQRKVKGWEGNVKVGL